MDHRLGVWAASALGTGYWRPPRDRVKVRATRVRGQPGVASALAGHGRLRRVAVQ